MRWPTIWACADPSAMGCGVPRSCSTSFSTTSRSTARRRSPPISRWRGRGCRRTPAPLWWAHRLTVVRGFAGYLHVLDEAHEVPATDVLPWKSHRANPFLYTDAEIAALIAAAAALRFPLRVATYQTLIALLAVTGMRIGEAISLNADDFDDDHGVLLVRKGKGGATRQLPLHPSTTGAMHAYLQRPDRRSTAR